MPHSHSVNERQTWRSSLPFSSFSNLKCALRILFFPLICLTSWATFTLVLKVWKLSEYGGQYSHIPSLIDLIERDRDKFSLSSREALKDRTLIYKWDLPLLRISKDIDDTGNQTDKKIKIENQSLSHDREDKELESTIIPDAINIHGTQSTDVETNFENEEQRIREFNFHGESNKERRPIFSIPVPVKGSYIYLYKRWYKHRVSIFRYPNFKLSEFNPLSSFVTGFNNRPLSLDMQIQVYKLPARIFAFILIQFPNIWEHVHHGFVTSYKLGKPFFNSASSLMSSILPTSFLFVDATLEQCQIDCTRNATYRPTNQQTRPEALDLTLDYPYSQAPETNPYPEFCQLGCTYFYSTSPNNVTCKRRCDFTYRYNLSVGYSDWAEVARWECRDGCDIALARCQAGYYCTNGTMTICPAGRWRNVTYSAVEECIDCERGRFRARSGGTSMDSCSKCPQGKYVNTTGTISDYKCNRCPDGKFGPEPGMALCKCITPRSCEDEWESFKRESIPFEGRW